MRKSNDVFRLKTKHQTKFQNKVIFLAVIRAPPACTRPDTSLPPTTVIRSASSLAVWAAAPLQSASWGAAVIDEFYATAILLRYLGATATAWLLMLLAVALLLLAAREI